jgi:hypothetical protein
MTKTDAVVPIDIHLPNLQTQPPPVELKKPNQASKNENENELSAKFYWERAIATSNLHRLNNIYTAKSLALKLILATLFLLSAGYCSYQIANTIMAFSSYSVLTTTSYKYEIPAEFPGESNKIKDYGSTRIFGKISKIIGGRMLHRIIFRSSNATSSNAISSKKNSSPVSSKNQKKNVHLGFTG